MKEIKTKHAKKDIKLLDKATDITRRAKNAYIRTKEKSDQLGYNDDSNYVDYAGNNVREGVETIVRKGSHTTENYSKNAVKKGLGRGVPNADARRPDTHNGESARQTSKSKAKGTVYRNAAPTETKRAAERSPTPTKMRDAAKQKVSQPGVKKVAKQFAVQSMAKEPVKRKFTMSGDKAIKEASRGTVKTVRRSVKTADRTAKTVVKTSQAVARTAAKTAQATQRSVQVARAAARASAKAARAAAVSAKTAVKAMVDTIKVSIVAVKGMIYLIAAGGWIAVVIILIVCLAGLLLGSGFGVFFSNESSGENTPTMTEVARQLNEEFAARIEQIKVENPHDTLDLSDNGSSTIVSNWMEILPVYAVKAAVDPEIGMEVATLDDTKKGILRGIFWDMNRIDYWAETIEHEETITTTDEDGNETEETVTITETILHINVAFKTHVDMIAEYKFNSDQVEMLHELMQDEYQQLFMQLIGG